MSRPDSATLVQATREALSQGGALSQLDPGFKERPQQLALDLNGLAAGAYYCQVREARRTGSRIVVVE